MSCTQLLIVTVQNFNGKDDFWSEIQADDYGWFPDIENHSPYK